MQITSRDNSLLRQVRAVRDGKIDELIFIEGLRLCEEAYRSDLAIEAVVVSEELLRKERAAGVIEELSRVSKRVGSVSEKLLESVSYTKTPQGIIVLAQKPAASEERLTASLNTRPLLVVLHQINNPVNIGAIIRTAEAAGATG
ncbi:MAG TPA: RNA methyltransferase substrate-binding domain-containing protein, partial [Pyrinomonadaceae bacterium]|nr:RNA methyltransferase substrate-binding domain-containing protein [Pyrinomonadaceae bacterium]